MNKDNTFGKMFGEIGRRAEATIESLRLCRFETDASPDSYISVVARYYVSNFRKMLADGKST